MAVKADGLLNKQRLETLIDGVYAIAMTVMVLNLSVPAGRNISSTADLLRALPDLGSQILAYVISYLILASSWMRNNRDMLRLNSVNRPLARSLLLTLLFVCLVPFTTALMNDYSGLVVAEMLFHLNIFALGMLSWQRYRHLRQHRHLIVEDEEERSLKAGSLRAGVSFIGAPLAGMALALWWPQWSTLTYLFVPVILQKFKPHRKEAAV